MERSSTSPDSLIVFRRLKNLRDLLVRASLIVTSHEPPTTSRVFKINFATSCKSSKLSRSTVVHIRKYKVELSRSIHYKIQ